MIYNMQVVLLLLVTAVTCYAQAASDRESFVLNGVKVVHSKGVSILGYTLADMLLTVPAEDELPGYTLVIRERREADKGILPGTEPVGHTLVWLGKEAWISRCWIPIPNAQAYWSGQIPDYVRLKARGSADVEVRISDTNLEYTYAEFSKMSSAIFRRGTPSAKPLGDEAWYNLNPDRKGGVVYFRAGNCLVRVGAPDYHLAEALAQGILYRLLVHPKGIVKPMPVPQLLVDGKPLSSPLIASLNGVVVVPVSLLKPFGVEVQTNRTSEMWTVTLRHGSRWVQVQAFGWEAQTPSGKVKLERAVFPFQGELVVPLRQVAEALGFSVQAQ